MACFPVIIFVALKSALSQVNISTLGGESDSILEASLLLGCLEFFTVRLVHIESPTIYQLQFIFSYSGTASRGNFLSLVFMLVYSDSRVHLPLPSWENALLWVLPSFPLFQVQEKLLIFQLVQLFTFC